MQSLIGEPQEPTQRAERAAGAELEFGEGGFIADMDPLQRKMMNMMPVVFAVMFAFFPAGLVLYWATNAGLSLAQQVYITRKIAAGEN